MEKLKVHKNVIDINDKYNINDTEIGRGVLYIGDHVLLNNPRDNKQRDDNKLLAATIIGTNNTNIPLPDDVEFYNCWTDADAHEAYLKEKPKCYMILGKQGTGSHSLGEFLAKKLNCIHICPKNILNDEMEQRSLTGKCLDFNMRHNKVCNFNIILRIMKEKLKSPAIIHRGYVISGLPLVPSTKQSLYLHHTLVAEESLCIIETLLDDLLYNLRKKKNQNVPATISNTSQSSELEISSEEEVEEEQANETVIDEAEQQIVELPKFNLNACQNVIYDTKYGYISINMAMLGQIQELFDFQPDIIIYISCPNTDVITKRSHKYINSLNNSSTIKPFDFFVDQGIRWPRKYTLVNLKKTYDSHIFNPKYNCKQPINFPTVVTRQLCNYEEYLTSFLDNKLYEYKPKNIIKLDGRAPTLQSAHICFERILLMSIKPVIIPEPLYVEDPPDDFEEFWKLVEQLNVIRSGAVKFSRYPSLWYNRCPVELKRRKSMQGNARFAVTFFKHVFLLSSLAAMVEFCRNPRPFLKLKYLEPTCRIIIIGTQTSGKTMITQCLSWLFDATIICYTTLWNKIRKKKYDMYSENIFKEIMAKVEDARFTEWQNKELDRISNLNTWFNTVSSRLTAYVSLVRKKLAQTSTETLQHTILNKMNSLKNQLNFLPVDNLNECAEILKENELLRFAPSDLNVEIPKPIAPSLHDEDIVLEIASYIKLNDLEKEIDPMPDEVTSEMITIIQDIDNNSFNSSESSYGKFIIDGYPSDSEYWVPLSESGLLPDYTIALVENREIDLGLLQHYIEIQNCFKNHQDRFVLANDPLIKTKLLQINIIKTSWSDMQIIVQEMLTGVFNFLLNKEESATVDPLNEDNLLTSFTETIEKFLEDWNNLKPKLEENLKPFIEVELENKSDIDIIDEVLLKVRKCYISPGSVSEEPLEIPDNESESVEDVSYNNPYFFGETNIYCPIAFYDYDLLWEGKVDWSMEYFNKFYYTCNENCSKMLQYDITKYQFYNNPFKTFPPLRICVVGSIGSGKSTVSKLIAKEFGLFHIDFEDFVNEFLIPKHFKKIGWRYENSFTDVDDSDDEDTDLHLEEDQLTNITDILYNEKEIRRMLKSYFEQGMSLPSILISTLIRKLWFANPYTTAGVVIDGFPQLPSDVDDMINHFCIPDVIVELESDSELAIERISPKMFQKWKLQFEEAKRKADNHLELEKNKWKRFITRETVINLIIDEILKKVIVETEPQVTESMLSTIIDADPTGSFDIDVNLFTIYNALVEEYPEPVDNTEWEQADDALEKIQNKIESIYEVNYENIQSFKDILNDQKIKIESFNGKHNFNKLSRKVVEKISKLRLNRSESLFEQTFSINCDIAEILLLEGFFLLSKFNRMCPVFIKENPHTIYNPYNIRKQKNRIFPVIYRAYIYFISSKDYVRKFRKNPLTYIREDIIKWYQSYPLSIGIIGPPKSGKSELSSKIAKHYGLICISRGSALRYILENMKWTSLGLKILSSLHEGDTIENQVIMDAVMTVAIDNRTMTNGFVLDDIPNSPYEVCELNKSGLFPIIMFDLEVTKENILRNTQSELYYDILKIKPPYCSPLIDNRFLKWADKSYLVRNWIYNDTQNLHKINGNNSKWQCYNDTIKVIEQIIHKIYNYLLREQSDIVCVDFMAVSNRTFEQRMSSYKNLCPVCFQQNNLRHSGYPPDKQGIVQYDNCFYWICSEHIAHVLKDPKEILCNKKIVIPEIPAPVNFVDTSIVYENGICIVTYAENLPAQKIVSGHKKFAALYNKKNYLFCSSRCHYRFLSKPQIYYDVNVCKETQIFSKLSLKELPHLGYLEQSVGNIITEACCAVNAARPKYPGLDSSLSALLYIALFLKIHNCVLKKEELILYKKAFKVFEARCKLLRDIRLRLRSIDNPFAAYPKCCNKGKPKQLEDLKDINSIPTTVTLYTESELNFVE